eukprot:NODE_254_length_11700_cov_0.671580.p11 type:complete len:126 gc:universal NODE_254_length_11700_cov_0.671580:5581-5204(-)
MEVLLGKHFIYFACTNNKKLNGRICFLFIASRSLFPNSMSNFRIPVQSLLPLGIITGVLAAGAFANKKLSTWVNDGVPQRHGMDLFEKMLLERDFRLVGNYSKQTDTLDPKSSFATNSKSYIIKF